MDFPCLWALARQREVSPLKNTLKWTETVGSTGNCRGTHSLQGGRGQGGSILAYLPWLDSSEGMDTNVNPFPVSTRYILQLVGLFMNWGEEENIATTLKKARHSKLKEPSLLLRKKTWGQALARGSHTTLWPVCLSNAYRKTRRIQKIPGS